MEKVKKRRGGWTPKPTEERKVMVFCTVKRKHFKEAQKAVRALCEQWR